MCLSFCSQFNIQKNVILNDGLLLTSFREVYNKSTEKFLLSRFLTHMYVLHFWSCVHCIQFWTPDNRFLSDSCCTYVHFTCIIYLLPDHRKNVIQSFFYKNVKFWVEAQNFSNFSILSPKMLLILRSSKGSKHS